MLNLYDGKILRELVFGIKPDVFNPPKKVYFRVPNINYIYDNVIVAGYYDEDKGKYYGIACDGILVPNPLELVNWDFDYFCIYLKEHYPEEFTISDSEVLNKNKVLIAHRGKKGPKSPTNQKMYVEIPWDSLSPEVIENEVKGWIDRKPEKEEMKPQNENLWTDKKQCTVEDLLIIESSCKLNAYWVQYETERFIRDQIVNWDGLEIDKLKRALASRESNLDKDWTTDTGYIRITGMAMTRAEVC